MTGEHRELQYSGHLEMNHAILLIYLPNRVRNWIADDHENAYEPYKVSTHCQTISGTDCLWYNLGAKVLHYQSNHTMSK